MKFSIKDFFSKCDQIRRKLRIWSQLLKKSLMENFIFCAVVFAYLLLDQNHKLSITPKSFILDVASFLLVQIHNNSKFVRKWACVITALWMDMNPILLL